MGINVSVSMGFSNREFLNRPAKKFVRKEEPETNEVKSAGIVVDTNAETAIEKTLSTSAINNISDQININSKLMETLKYLQTHANDKRKKYTFGELWQKLENISDSKDELSDVLVDLDINFSENNIFAA